MKKYMLFLTLSCIPMCIHASQPLTSDNDDDDFEIVQHQDEHEWQEINTEESPVVAHHETTTSSSLPAKSSSKLTIKELTPITLLNKQVTQASSSHMHLPEQPKNLNQAGAYYAQIISLLFAQPTIPYRHPLNTKILHMKTLSLPDHRDPDFRILSILNRFFPLTENVPGVTHFMHEGSLFWLYHKERIQPTYPTNLQESYQARIQLMQSGWQAKKKNSDDDQPYILFEKKEYFPNEIELLQKFVDKFSMREVMKTNNKEHASSARIWIKKDNLCNAQETLGLQLSENQNQE